MFVIISKSSEDIYFIRMRLNQKNVCRNNYNFKNNFVMLKKTTKYVYELLQ